MRLFLYQEEEKKRLLGHASPKATTGATQLSTAD
jgi:hypothetical protein